ncbi:MAG TPA: peptide chain release factor N(5)-glutamine methyltransferase [Chitinophagaceae bacterium]|nr:peptide chain release factor N(5)-glutamine methyltransferase [Chitinophagaceae bacterium]
MTIQQASIHIRNELKNIYEDREVAAMTDWIIEKMTGIKKTDRIINKEKELNNDQAELLENWLPRLIDHEPLQYVLQEAWFGGMKFYVDQNVLIPRPETEELADWIISDCKFPIRQLTLLDIGCGSGCISIFLKRKLRKADVWACDVSEAALNIAKQNADALGADIHFLQVNFLKESERNKLAAFDIIVSNPPYVPENDKLQMQPNVLRYEPPIALFVPDDDALIFYKAIADFGRQKLNPNGAIYAEIHEELGTSVLELFRSKNYKATLKKDMQGKDRMIKAVLII